MITLILSIIGGILYRMGGSENYNTKWRDLGIPAIIVLLMTELLGWGWSYSLCFLLLFGALTTYNDWVNDFVKNETLQWVITSASYGLAMFPFAIASGCYLNFIIRVILLTALITWLRIWNKPIWKWSSDVVVEFGNGFLIVSTIPLLFL